jgi:hypothetical protein
MLNSAFHKLNVANRSPSIIHRYLLTTLLFSTLRLAFSKLKSNLTTVRNLRRTDLIHTILRNAKYRILAYAWSKLICKGCMGSSNKVLLIQQLVSQVNGIKAQVENKNQAMNKLQEEVVQLRQAALHHSSSSYIFASQPPSKSGSFISKHINTSFENGSNDGREKSLGGDLWGISMVSVLSAKSRASVVGESAAKCECSRCPYRD